MALSYTTYSSTAASYSIGFSYLSTSHVKVLAATVDGAARTILGTSDYSIDDSTKLLTITPTIYPTSTAPLKIYRDTPGLTEATKDIPFVNFVNGTVLNEADLDNASLQALYLAQESRDHVDDSLATAVGNENLPSIAEAGQIVVSNESLIAEWDDVDTVISANVAATANTIPRRNASSKIVGDVTGNLEGVADEAVILQTSRDFSISGDVSTSSGVGFDGSGATDLPTTVDKIQGVVVSSTTPTEGQVLQYDDTASKWVPTAKSGLLAIFAVGSTEDNNGQTIKALERQEVKLDLDFGDQRGLTPIGTDWEDCSLNTTTGMITLKNGIYRFEWTQAFSNCGSGYSALISSDASTTTLETTPSGATGYLLDDSPAVDGKGTVADDNNYLINATSHGWGRVDASLGTKYVQLQAYTEKAGDLGRSDTTGQPFNHFHTLVIIHKE